jgi:hypothetical protein
MISLILIGIFVISFIGFVVYYATQHFKREPFRAHTSDFISPTGVYNNAIIRPLINSFNSITLYPKPEKTTPTFANKIDLIKLRDLDDSEKGKLVEWIEDHLGYKVVKMQDIVTYTDNDVSTAQFFIDIHNELYYPYVKLEISLSEDPPKVHSIEILGLETKLNVMNHKSSSTAKISLPYGSMLEDPRLLSKNTIRHELKQFEDSKWQILLRNREIV